ncbi:AAA family ATPase [Paenibacillus barcinonensis]|uniref:AAA family ATPase n=1 Tax=Paenibacillus barcinonensis TaxID=198119 RepID=A0A2V4VAQ6_PAEBA|nr:AAA family ATPase [Paenibacillus barcinonensis]PYE49277.1 putative ATP-dependent endonuclease of OLD family [Paenibacillus barcinonensis]QKS55500.1 AAA family ATPase [Paenibacillus barcinonensis]
MLLKRVKINNFRSLKNVDIPLTSNTFLIGENNSGKTAFLDVLRIGLGKLSRKSSPFEEYDYFIENEVSGPRDSEGISIEFTFQEEKPEDWDVKITQILGEIVQLAPFEDNEAEALNTIVLKVVSKFDNDANDFILESKFMNLSGQELAGANSRKIFDLQQLSPIFYLQALRDIRDFFSPNSQFWGKFLRKINIPSEKVESIQESLLTINNELISSDDNLEKVISSLENIQNVLALNSQDMVSINALPFRTWDILSKAQVVMKGKGTDVTFPLDRHGQGTQSLATLFLFQAYIDIILKSTLTNESEAILALEEPEAHLHPQASRSLANKLTMLNCQKIISTHSPYFIQNANLFDLRVFRKIGKETKVFFLKQYVSVEIEIQPALVKFCTAKGPKFHLNSLSNKLTVREAISSHEASGLKGMYANSPYESTINDLIIESQTIISKDEENKLYTYIQRTRGEILFARGWLLAEGQTEYIVLNYFADLLGLSLDENGISIIDYQNNGSPGAFVKVAKILNYPWYLLSDNDAQGEGTLEQLKKLNYTEEEIDALTTLLPHIDFETYLANEGFTEEYLQIASENGFEILPDDLGIVDKRELALIIQKDKVGNARRLVDILKGKNSDNSRVPELIKTMIERCVSSANE